MPASISFALASYIPHDLEPARKLRENPKFDSIATRTGRPQQSCAEWQLRMVHEGHTRIEAAAAAVGVDRHSRRHLGCRRRAIRRKDAGQRPDEQKALSPEQEIRIRRLIAETCPDQLDLSFALWTREPVGLLIERKTGVRLSSRTTIGDDLHDWRFTPQRARKRATERREAAVRIWMDRDYPAIAARAKAEAGEIHWSHETGVANQATTGAASPPRAARPSSRGRRHAWRIR